MFRMMSAENLFASFLPFRARARNALWVLHFAYASFSMTKAGVSFRAQWGIQHGCFASFSM